MSAVHPASKRPIVPRTAFAARRRIAPMGPYGVARSPAGANAGRPAPIWFEAFQTLLRRREFRFIVAGGSASAINWISRFPLALFLSFETAVAFAYAIGMGVGFVLYRAWVFDGSRGCLRRQLPRFFLVNAFGLAAVMSSASAFLWVLAPSSWLSEGSTRALAHSLALIVGAAVNFAGHRSLTFARRRVGRPEP